jgi:NAD-dependent dihydropyrimidine dehydrogenase PreA subunit
MRINRDLCMGCETCVPHCPFGAISVTEGVASINEDACVECRICRRAKACTVDAIEVNDLQYPRTIRAIFSDVFTLAPNTGVGGRGTEEMKTNDVTGRFRKGRVGVAVELGRPGIGTRMRDVEKIAMAIAQYGVRFEPDNPISPLLQESATGKFLPEVLNERVLSAIIEFEIHRAQLKGILETIRETAKEIDTVFSLDVATVLENGKIPIDDILREVNMERRPNGKTNVGLGRPRKEDI